MSRPPRVLYTADQIAHRVRELGAQITRDLAGREPVIIGVLKGAFVFLADLVRAIDLPLSCDFLRVASYGDATQTSGRVRFEFDTTQPISNRDVVLVEDIVDTGLTLSAVLEPLRGRAPASLRVAALLHKPSRTQKAVGIDYLGFEIPDQFVVGYGLDYAGRFRNLPHLAVLEAEGV